MNSSDADLIDRFLEMMAAERGVARNTIAAYQSDLFAASRLIGGGLADAATAFDFGGASTTARAVGAGRLGVAGGATSAGFGAAFIGAAFAAVAVAE